jgi:hypothetical protein
MATFFVYIWNNWPISVQPFYPKSKVCRDIDWLFNFVYFFGRVAFQCSLLIYTSASIACKDIYSSGNLAGLLEHLRSSPFIFDRPAGLATASFPAWHL